MRIFLNIINGLFSFFKYPLYFIIFIVCVFCIASLLWYFFFYFKGYRRIKGVHLKVKKHGFLYNLLVDMPRRYIQDIFNHDPEFFRYQGCIIYTGRQGSGKTVAMIEQTLRFQMEYPKLKCITNLNYKYQDDDLSDWHQLTDYKNGIQGVVVDMDELQNWFSSNQSKNFPPEMLEVVTQNRKNRRIIQGTAQSFNRLSKPLREQATEVRKCFTLLGCLTIIHRVIPELDSNGDVKKWRHRGFYYFVHSDKIRDSYDTYHVINSLSKAGFVERQTDVNVTLH